MWHQWELHLARRRPGYPVPPGWRSTVRRCLVQTSRPRLWTFRSDSRARRPACATWPPRAGRSGSPARPAAGERRGFSSVDICGSARPRTLRAARWAGSRRPPPSPGAIVHTYGWGGYIGLSKLGYDHRPRSQRAQPGEQLLPRAPCRLQPQGLDPWHPPRRRRPPSAGLPRRVRLPPQPPPHADGSLPDPARPRHPAPAHDLRPDHPARSGGSLSQPDTAIRFTGRPAATAPASAR